MNFEFYYFLCLAKMWLCFGGKGHLQVFVWRLLSNLTIFLGVSKFSIFLGVF